MIEAAETLVIQAFSKWFITPSTKRSNSLISWKREKNGSGIQDVMCLPTHRHLSVHQPIRKNAHWETGSSVWQALRLIHQRAKADQIVLCGSWRSFCLLHLWLLFLLLYNCLVASQLCDWCVTSPCLYARPLYLLHCERTPVPRGPPLVLQVVSEGLNKHSFSQQFSGNQNYPISPDVHLLKLSFNTCVSLEVTNSFRNNKLDVPSFRE